MTYSPSPIADGKDRRAIAHIIARIRPDWDLHGIESALAKHPSQDIDLLAAQAIIAAVSRPDQHTPAILSLDADHTSRARSVLGAPAITPQPPHEGARGPRCGSCGVPERDHVYPRVDHEWTPTVDAPPATPQRIAAAHAAWLAARGNVRAQLERAQLEVDP